MEKNYKEDEISENESEDGSQFQVIREMNKLDKIGKTIKEILKPDFKKIIVFVALTFIVPILFCLLCRFYYFLCNFSNFIECIIYFSLLLFSSVFSSGIFIVILYYFIHYLFACLIIYTIYNVEIIKNNIKRIFKNNNTRRIFIYSIAIIIGIIIFGSVN